MSHAVKLMFFFIISVALHGAGLWAAAGRYEAREPEASPGVAIVDRDLFFRHAARSETQASNPVSATDRITPRSGSALRPSQPGESVAPASAAAAAEAELERRAPASPAAGAMARLDPSTVEPAPAPRRQAAAMEGIDAERREPVRMSSVDATAPPAAMRAQAERSDPVSVPARTSDALVPSSAARQASLVIAPPLLPAGEVRQAARARAPKPDDVPDSRPVRRPLEAAAQIDARAADALARTAADAAVHGTVERIAKAPPAPTQFHAPALAAMAQVERGEPETAQGLPAAEAPRLAPPGIPAPADLAARDGITPLQADRPVAPETDTVTAAAPTTDATPATAATATAADPTAAVPIAAAPAQVPGDRLALRGTLPAPLLAARQPQVAELLDAPEPAAQPAEGLRLRASLPAELEPGRATVAALQAEPVRAAERAAAPAPASARSPPAPDAAAVSRPAPRDLAAVAPETPTRRLESAESLAGRGDPVDRFTRAYQGGECFFPLRLASRDGAAIRGYGLQAESVDMFRQAFAQALGSEPNVDWRPLTDAQCGGISFTRLVLGDSSPTVRIALERKDLDSGQDLIGRVTGSRLAFVTMLVVDDSGVVHNVLDHLRPEAADLAFAIPVQPVDDGTDRVQLIMAVGASEPLPILTSTTPVHSDDFFPTLRDQTIEAGAYLELGLEDFVIRDGR